MFGEKIKTLRLDRGLSVRQLAHLTTVAYSTMLNIEKDKQKPSARVLLKISDFFNVETDFWYRNDNDVKVVNDTDQKLLRDANRLKEKEVKKEKPKKQDKENITQDIEAKPIVSTQRTAKEQEEFLKSLHERQISIREDMIGILRKEIATKEELLDNYKQIIDELLTELKRK